VQFPPHVVLTSHPRGDLARWTFSCTSGCSPGKALPRPPDLGLKVELSPRGALAGA
jgi:hypothetical protein